MSVTPEVKAEFMRRLVKGGPDECWLQGNFHPNSKGYPQFQMKRDGRAGTFAAHRLSYEIHKGAIPPGMQVRHQCQGNAWCVAPHHLYLGSARDNAIDASRAKRRRGNGQAHRTDDHVREIRSKYAAGWTMRQIAEHLDENTKFIADVVQGLAWKHLGGKIERRAVYERDADGKLISTRYEMVKIHEAEAPADYVDIGVHIAPIDANLTSDNVADLKRMRGQGLSVARTARMFAISVQMVRAIDRGELFADIEGPPPRRSGPLSVRRRFVAKLRKLRLADEAIAEAKQMRASGVSRREVAAKFNVSPDYIKEIDLGRKGGHVPGPLPAPYVPPKKLPHTIIRGPLTAALAWDIKTALASGKTAGAVAREFMRALTTVRDIRDGRAWAHVDIIAPRPEDCPKHGPKPEWLRGEIPEELREHALSLLLRGMPIVEVARITLINPRTVQRIADRAYAQGPLKCRKAGRLA